MAEEQELNEQAAEGGESAARETQAEKTFTQKELDEIVKQRLERERKKSTEQKNTEAQSRIASLEHELNESRVKNILHEQAAALEIDSASVPYVARLADLSDISDENGNIDRAKIKAAVSKVLADIPALKAKKQETSGFIPIGANGNGGNASEGTSSDNKLRRAFGLKNS